MAVAADRRPDLWTHLGATCPPRREQTGIWAGGSKAGPVALVVEGGGPLQVVCLAAAVGGWPGGSPPHEVSLGRLERSRPPDC